MIHMNSPQNEPSPMLNDVLTYYHEKLIQYGPTARGVDWSNDDRQRLVFEEITKIFCSPRSGIRDSGFTLLDYCCCPGSLLCYLGENTLPFLTIIGFFLLPGMLATGT